MAETVIRIYETEAQASKAVAELREEGFANVFQFTAAPAKPAASAKGGAAAAKSATASIASLVNEMMAAHILKSHAESYAAELQNGGSLVKVVAEFGSGLAANQILDNHSPRSKGFETVDWGRDLVWDDAAPLSSVLQLPVLLRVEHPMELLTGISSLTKGTAFLSKLLGIPLLARGVEHETSSMGLPLLMNSATPFSSLFGLKVLK